ncbi:MAG: DNA/RNA non-specific endonuclease [Bacteroidota bacterium]
MRKRLICLLLLLPLSTFLAWGQSLQELEQELDALRAKEKVVLGKIEQVKLKDVHSDLMANGLPALKEGEDLIEHKALALVYSERHEQAKWVAHVILPDIIDGKTARSNDFREDPLVKTGTAVESDYFLKTEKADGTFDYDGFGYDRGHLAPSADFRWSPTALSESYFYSNMSPQLPEFNREIWADLEGKIRGYIFRNPKSTLYVVTGPLLSQDLPHIERGMNKVAIPDHFFKVVIDKENGRGIGFILPHKGPYEPLHKYAVTIDAVEQRTGIDFYQALEDGLESKVEAQKNVEDWLPGEMAGDVNPINPPDLPPKHFNTKQAKFYMDRSDKITVCGTVVSSRVSRKGNILMNLDKKFPDQIFTVFIRKEFISNFGYDPEKAWDGKVIAVTGKVANLGGTPAMFIEKETQLKEFAGR